MKIWLKSQSTLVAPEELEAWLPALQIYGNQVAHAWQITRPTLILGPAPSADSYQIVLLDNSDQAGALGYHDDPMGGGPISKIFVADDRKYDRSVTVTLTHELAEMMADPDIVRAMQTDENRLYALELGDPVEDDSYAYEIHGVLVSDFVYPAWFLPGRPGPFDKAGHVTSALQVLPGGYAQYFENGNWNQVDQHGQTTGPGERANRFRPRLGCIRMD